MTLIESTLLQCRLCKSGRHFMLFYNSSEPTNTGIVEDSHDGLNKDAAETLHHDPETEYIENMNMLTL